MTVERNIPWISRKSSANTGGPLSMALPEPLKTRPGMWQINVKISIELFDSISFTNFTGAVV